MQNKVVRMKKKSFQKAIKIIKECYKILDMDKVLKDEIVLSEQFIRLCNEIAINYMWRVSKK